MDDIYWKALKAVVKLATISGGKTPSSFAIPGPQPTMKSSVQTKPLMPTTDETLQELKRRLAKELYRAEMDLQAGARIASRPCDCLSKKHNLGLEAIAEELMSYDPNPVYNKVIEWFRKHEKEFEPSEIEKRPPEYYQSLAPEVRRLRKEVMGTEGETISLEEAKRLAAQEAEKEVERLWQSHNKT